MGLLRCGCGLLQSVYHGSSGGLAWWAVGYGLWVLDLGLSRRGSEILDLGINFGFGIGVTELGVDFGFGIGGDQRLWWRCGSRSMIKSQKRKISVVVGKACSCSWGFRLK